MHLCRDSDLVNCTWPLLRQEKDASTPSKTQSEKEKDPDSGSSASEAEITQPKKPKQRIGGMSYNRENDPKAKVELIPHHSLVDQPRGTVLFDSFVPLQSPQQGARRPLRMGQNAGPKVPRAAVIKAKKRRQHQRPKPKRVKLMPTKILPPLLLAQPKAMVLTGLVTHLRSHPQAFNRTEKKWAKRKSPQIRNTCCQHKRNNSNLMHQRKMSGWGERTLGRMRRGRTRRSSRRNEKRSTSRRTRTTRRSKRRSLMMMAMMAMMKMAEYSAHG